MSFSPLQASLRRWETEGAYRKVMAGAGRFPAGMIELQKGGKRPLRYPSATRVQRGVFLQNVYRPLSTNCKYMPR